MWTLQILDGAESWLHPLDGTPATIGSDQACTLRMDAQGLRPVHAKIETLRSGDLSLRAMDGAEVFCNGASVVRTSLSLGDQLQLGGVRFVVGQRVEREANETDVLSRTVRSRGIRASNDPNR